MSGSCKEFVTSFEQPLYSFKLLVLGLFAAYRHSCFALFFLSLAAFMIFMCLSELPLLEADRAQSCQAIRHFENSKVGAYGSLWPFGEV
jgi:hypothetical protein